MQSPIPNHERELSKWQKLQGSLIINGKIVFFKDTDTLASLQHRRSIRLSPLSARTLIIFAFCPFDVIKREKLMRALWYDHGFIVTENSLNQAVCKLRESFRAIYCDQDFIKTIPRIGYSFVGSVHVDTRSIDEIFPGGAPPAPKHHASAT
ncbi:DNA-binding transcriptional regulator BaeR [Caballeronia calidae]|uniref:DNA-binding transcriptional regulator BaeR n=1 Tax=Caballeronia calidae TaxID=1777139 RepID=A0A158EHF0_9BURK|nr:winged helix-turn-helix domain-containing protein [Caballeronia calidae]SAL06285.1 DNA-binding transcriptional regulator BaeR [Caballeronia calidae]